LDHHSAARIAELAIGGGAGARTPVVLDVRATSFAVMRPLLQGLVLGIYVCLWLRDGVGKGQQRKEDKSEGSLHGDSG
jgi:hypothetical protein